MKTQIRFMRHSFTSSSLVTGSPDRMRLLSQSGIYLAQSTGTKWMEEGFVPQRIVTSAAPRAQQTGILIEPEAPISAHEELYFGTNPAWMGTIGGAFKELANAPLNRYLQVSPEVTEALHDYAAAASQIIRGDFTRNEIRQGLVVMHALMAPAVGFFMAEETEDKERIANLVLEECEHFDLEIEF